MKTIASLLTRGLPPMLCALCAAQAIATPEPQRRVDQRQAFQERSRGRLLPLPEIESRIVPTMRGAQYIGVDFDSDSAIYTLKFLRDGTVIWVEVDGQSGKVVGRTGR